MPGNQLVPYDPNRVPRYQIPKPSRLERFNDVMEAILVDGKGRELGAVVRALGAAAGLAFAVSAAGFLFWAMEVGIVTGRAWSLHPSGPFAGMLAFLCWWFLETWQFWRWIAVLLVVFAPWLGTPPAKALYVKFLRERRRQREAHAAAEARQIREYQERVAENVRREQAAQEAATKATAEAAEAAHARLFAYRQQRAAELAAIEGEVGTFLARERISGFAKGEDSEEPYKRVRAMLKKQKLGPRYGLLHDTEDLDVRRVIGQSWSWLPLPIPHPPEFAAAPSIGKI